MSMGYVGDHLPLVESAMLAADHHLWDAGRTRLTVLLLIGHREAGYVLQTGGSFPLVVDTGFRDAHGVELAATGRRRYTVGGDERRPIDPSRWSVAVPREGSREPVTVAFDRPLDHGLPNIGCDQRSWNLTPDQP